jgi:hypothetical protein
MMYMRDHAAKEDNIYRLDPIYSFTHSSGSVLVFSTFAIAPTVEFQQFALRVYETYRKARAELYPQETWITLNGMRALQIYSATESTIHVKIILDAGEPLSLDYTIPRQAWDTERRDVESSLASVHVITPQEELHQ